MKLVKPVTEEKRRELEAELQKQKERFIREANLSAEKLKALISPRFWLERHPVESAGILVLTGFLIGSVIKSKLNKKPRSSRLLQMRHQSSIKPSQ